MDKIFIEHLAARGKHGISDEERAHDQEFVLDIGIQFDTKRASISDALEDTVNYGDFRGIAKQIVEGESFHLLEKLADTVATRILEDARIASVSVSVRKTEIYQDGTPGVTVVRTRP